MNNMTIEHALFPEVTGLVKIYIKQTGRIIFYVCKYLKVDLVDLKNKIIFFFHPKIS